MHDIPFFLVNCFLIASLIVEFNVVLDYLLAEFKNVSILYLMLESNLNSYFIFSRSYSILKIISIKT